MIDWAKISHTTQTDEPEPFCIFSLPLKFLAVHIFVLLMNLWVYVRANYQKAGSSHLLLLYLPPPPPLELVAVLVPPTLAPSNQRAATASFVAIAGFLSFRFPLSPGKRLPRCPRLQKRGPLLFSLSLLLRLKSFAPLQCPKDAATQVACAICLLWGLILLVKDSFIFT